jgi:hypothetical protein
MTFLNRRDATCCKNKVFYSLQMFNEAIVIVVYSIVVKGDLFVSSNDTDIQLYIEKWEKRRPPSFDSAHISPSVFQAGGASIMSAKIYLSLFYTSFRRKPY